MGARTNGGSSEQSLSFAQSAALHNSCNLFGIISYVESYRDHLEKLQHVRQVEVGTEHPLV